MSRRARLGAAFLILVVSSLVVLLASSSHARHLLVHGRLPPAPPTGHPLVRSFQPDGTSLRSCARMPDDPLQPRQMCRARALGNLAFERGPKRAFAEMRRLSALDPSWGSDVHISAHFIGAAALARRGDDAASAFGEGSSFGGGGYYHGLMVQLLGRVSGSSMVGIVRETCHAPAIAATDFARIKCYHGAGHGFLVLSGHDLPRALELCDEASVTEGEANNCSNGVFMENLGELYGLTSPGFRSPWLDENDLEFPCNRIVARHRAFCYSHVASRAGPVLRWDWRRLGELCGTLPARMNRQACFQSVGLWANARSNDDVDALLAACDRARAPQVNCVGGAVKAIVNDDPEHPASAEAARKVCVASSVPEACFRAIGTVLRKLGPDAHESACRRLTSRHVDACLTGERQEQAIDLQEIEF